MKVLVLTVALFFAVCMLTACVPLTYQPGFEKEQSFVVCPDGSLQPVYEGTDNF